MMKDAMSNVLYATADEIMLILLLEKQGASDENPTHEGILREIVMIKIRWIAAAQRALGV